MFFIGTPTAQQKKMYYSIHKPSEQVLRNAHAGMKSKEINRYAQEVLVQEKIEHTMKHGLGHGVGLDVHERPGIGPTSNHIIKNNAVTSVEPGMYLKNAFGIRIEDTVVYQQQGVDVLTTFPKDLNHVIIG